MCCMAIDLAKSDRALHNFNVNMKSKFPFKVELYIASWIYAMGNAINLGRRMGTWLKKSMPLKVRVGQWPWAEVDYV